MKKPKCFKSNPGFQDNVENDCHTCKFNNTCFNGWEEEFNDILNFENTMNGGYSEWVELENNDLSDLFTKWITKKLTISKPVKVKCKDGMIQIERIN